MKTPQLVALLVGGAMASVLALTASVASIAGTTVALATWADGRGGPGVTSETVAPDPVPSPDQESSAAPWDEAPYSNPLVYENRDGVLMEKESQQEADAELAAVWSLFVAIAGPDAASVVDVAVFDDRAEATDASVARDMDDSSLWHAEINMASAGDRDYLVRTLVHEYGHIASLSVGDVAQVDGACPVFEFSEGCVSEGSILGRFLDEFWSGDEAGAEDESASEDEAQARFEAGGETQTFVSAYAATNGAEDFAETFTAFVLGPETELDPASTAQAKIDLLAGDARMEALRARILAAVA